MVGIVSSLVLRLVYERVALADCLHGPEIRIHWSSHVIAILPLHTFCVLSAPGRVWIATHTEKRGTGTTRNIGEFFAVAPHAKSSGPRDWQSIADAYLCHRVCYVPAKQSARCCGRFRSTKSWQSDTTAVSVVSACSYLEHGVVIGIKHKLTLGMTYTVHDISHS